MNFVYPKDIHQALIDKSKIAIGWGVPSDLLSKIKQAPYQFEFLIEGNSDSENCIGNSLGIDIWGTGKLITLDPQKYIIVILPDLKRFGEQIVSQVEGFGNFKVVAPFCPWLHIDCGAKIDCFIQDRASDVQFGAQPLSNIKEEKVALVIYGFTRGGAEWQFFLLAKALSFKGKKVTIFSMQRPVKSTQHWLDELTDIGVTIVFLPEHLRNTDKIDFGHIQDELLAFLPASDSRLVLTMYYLMKSEDFGYCISYLLTANLLGSLAAILSKISRILISTRCSAPGTVVDDFPETAITDINLECKARLLASMIKHGNVKISANSRFGAQTYAEWLGIPLSNVRIVTNGLVEPQLVSSDHIRKKLGVTSASFLVLGVMRLTHQKRPLLFIDCIAALKDRHPNVCAVILGDGELRSDVIKYIDSKGLKGIVTLLGEQTSPSVYMQAANLVLQTSEFEGLPNVILESQQVGCPVVCSNAGGSQEALAPEVVHNCLVFDNKPESFVTKILGFTENKNIAQFKFHAVNHIKGMTLENLALNTLHAAN